MPQDSHILRMFTSLLNTSTSVDPEIHRAAWAHACETGNTALRRTLVARLDAPADLVTHYAALTESELRGIYTARPDLGTVQQAESLRGERRVKVLVDALKKTGNAAPVLAVAVEAFTLKPTKALAEHFLSLDTAYLTPELAAAILRTLGADERYEYSSRFDSSFKRVASCLQQDQVRAVLADVEHYGVIGHILACDVGDDLVLDTITRLAPALEAKLSSPDFDDIWVKMHHIMSGAVRGRPDSSEIRLAISRILGSGANPRCTALRREFGQVVIRTATTRTIPWAANPGQELRAILNGDTDADTGVNVASLDKGALLELAPSSRPQIVAAITEMVLSDISITFATLAVRHLLTNPVLGVDKRHEVLNALRHRPFSYGRTEMLDAITLFPGDDLVREVWCEVFASHVLEQHGWGPFGGPDRAAELLTRWSQSDNPASERAMSAALRVGVTPEALAALPARRAASLSMWNGLQSAEPVLLRLYSDMLAQAFAQTPHAWTMYEQLEPDFVGTIGELIDVCRTTMS